MLTTFEWLPWPFGTHWCAFETVLSSVGGVLLAINLAILAIVRIARVRVQ